MPRVLHCNDLMPGCSFEARGASEEEVLAQAAEHAKTAHGITEISPELFAKVQGANYDESPLRT